MLTNHEGFHEYSGPTYSRTLSSTKDMEMMKPLLFKSYTTQSSQKTMQGSIEDQFQINGYKTTVASDSKGDVIPVALVKPPRKSTRREIVLILICICLAILLLIVTIIMLKCLTVRDNSVYSVTDNKMLYCLTASCLKATSEITDIIGNTVNQLDLACENLEKFACGDWLNNSRIPPTIVNWNLLEELRYTQQEELRNILESHLGDLNESDYRWKFQMSFEKCINRDVMSFGGSCGKHVQGDSDIEEFLQGSRLKVDSLDHILQHTQIDLNIPIFFKTSIIRNYSNTFDSSSSTNIILLSEYDEEGMPDYKALQDRKEIDHLKEYIVESAKIVQFSQTQIDDLSEDFIAVLKSLRWASYNVNRGRKIFPEFTAVKINLTKLTALTEQTIDFAKYLVYYGSKRGVTETGTNILLSSNEYFKHISNIVSQSKFSKLINFIRFSIIHKYGSFVSQRLSNEKQKFLWRNTGRQHPFEVWQDCIELLNSPGIAGLHQMSMRNELNRHIIVKRIESSIAVHIKNSLTNIVQTLAINQNEKQLILEKVTNIKLIIPNLTNESLNNFYKNWTFSKNASLLKIMQTFPTKDELSILPDSLAMLASNGISTYSDLAEYIPEKNAILISNILLQWPFYSSDHTIPKYLEFATIGLWLAKSMADVFSYKASFFSSSGQRLRQPINVTFQSLFQQNQMKSFLDSKYSNQIKEFRLLNTTTAKSLIMIQMLESAYDIFQKDISTEQHVLPHLNYSTMQIMFIRLAQNFCSKIRPEYQLWMSRNDEVIDADNLKIMMFLKSYRNVFKCDSIKSEDNTE